jgi:hypothetical protein
MQRGHSFGRHAFDDDSRDCRIVQLPRRGFERICATLTLFAMAQRAVRARVPCRAPRSSVW